MTVLTCISHACFHLAVTSILECKNARTFYPEPAPIRKVDSPGAVPTTVRALDALNESTPSLMMIMMMMIGKRRMRRMTMW